jgi:uncharacterized membrane protein YhaH (DUF805 family)
MAWMRQVGTNRSAPDLYLGMVGYAFAALAVIATIAALALHPWRAGGRRGAFWLALHVAALAGVLCLATLWLALHLA